MTRLIRQTLLAVLMVAAAAPAAMAQSQPIEEEDPECPHGARGVGEIGLVPTAPCIAGALYKFDGVIRKQLPMRDSPAAQAILKPKRKK